MCCAYKENRNERYLKNMMSLLDKWVCAQTPGGSAAHKIGAKGYSLLIANTVCQNMTLLRTGGELSAIIKENSDEIKKLGYENILIAFDQTAKKYDKEVEIEKYSYPEVLVNVYESEKGTALFGMNQTGSSSGEFDKDIKIKIKDSGLWQGMKNIVSNPFEVELEEQNSQFDAVHSIKRPIFAEEILSQFDAEILEYSSDKIILRFYGSGKAKIKITNGEFAIDENRGYSITKSVNDTYTQYIIEHGGNLKSDKDSLLFNCIFGNYTDDSEITDKWFAESNIELNDTNAESINKTTRTLFGFNLLNSGEDVTYENLAWAMINKLNADYPEFLSAKGILGKKIEFIKKPSDIMEILNIAANAIELKYDENGLDSDIDLPSESLFNTKVEWGSSNESVLSNKGILYRNNISEDLKTVTLTAKLTKDGMEVLKEFEVPIKPKEPIKWKTAVAFSECAYPIVEQTSDFEITYSITPFRSDINALSGITDSKFGISAMSQLPVIVRFSPAGIIDAYDYNTYKSDTEIKYNAGETYTFRLEVRTEKQTYDVYVSSENTGENVLLAKDYRFRLSAPPPEKFNTMYLPAATEDNCFEMTANSLASYKKSNKININDENDMLGIDLKMNNYAISDLYLPPADDTDKITWLLENAGAVKDKICIDKFIGTHNLYYAEDSDKSITSMLDAAENIGLIKGHHNPLDNADISTVKSIIRTMGYFYNKNN